MSAGGPDPTAPVAARLTRLGQDYCVFARGGCDFAVSVAAVREALTGEPVTPVPQAPPVLVGVLNVRGEVLPLLHLEALLGTPPQPYTPGDQVLVLTCDDVDIGLVVDRVRNVRALDSAEIGAGPGGAPLHVFYRGYWVGPGGAVAVLDADKLVAEAIRLIGLRFQQGLPNGTDDSRRAAPLPAMDE